MITIHHGLSWIILLMAENDVKIGRYKSKIIILDIFTLDKVTCLRALLDPPPPQDGVSEFTGRYPLGMAQASLSDSELGADLSAWLAKIMAWLNSSTALRRAVCITTFAWLLSYVSPVFSSSCRTGPFKPHQKFAQWQAEHEERDRHGCDCW